MLVSLHAEITAPPNLQKLQAEAEVVVYGKVMSTTTAREAAGGICTEVEFQVLEVWKGSLKMGNATIVHSGGVLGEERLEVSGQAAYIPGDEFIAFLVRNSAGKFITVGMGLGKFTIKDHAVIISGKAVSLAQFRANLGKLAR